MRRQHAGVSLPVTAFSGQEGRRKKQAEMDMWKLNVIQLRGWGQPWWVAPRSQWITGNHWHGIWGSAAMHQLFANPCNHLRDPSSSSDTNVQSGKKRLTWASLFAYTETSFPARSSRSSVQNHPRKAFFCDFIGFFFVGFFGAIICLYGSDIFLVRFRISSWLRSWKFGGKNLPLISECLLDGHFRPPRARSGARAEIIGHGPSTLHSSRGFP